MTDFRRDVTYGLDGRFHEAELVDGATSLKIDDQVIGLDNPAIAVRLAVDGTGQLFAVCPTYGWHVLVRSDGSQIPITHFADGSETGGNRGFSAVRALPVGCEVYIAQKWPGSDGCTIHVFNEHGTELVDRAFSAPYSSMGILQIREDGSVTMVDVPPVTDVDGLELHYYQEQAGFKAGQKHIGYGLAVVTQAGVKLETTWQGSTNMPSYLAAHGHEVRLAIPGVDTPAPGQVVLVPMPGQPPIEPPIPPVDPPATDCAACEAELAKVKAENVALKAENVRLKKWRTQVRAVACAKLPE